MNAEVDSMLDELENLTSQMDIPQFRTRKVDWLSRNMAIRNADHPLFKQAQVLVHELKKMGVH